MRLAARPNKIPTEYRWIRLIFRSSRFFRNRVGTWLVNDEKSPLRDKYRRFARID